LRAGYEPQDVGGHQTIYYGETAALIAAIGIFSVELRGHPDAVPESWVTDGFK
jgi:hypothetical protein